MLGAGDTAKNRTDTFALMGFTGYWRRQMIDTDAMTRSSAQGL